MHNIRRLLGPTVPQEEPNRAALQEAEMGEESEGGLARLEQRKSSGLFMKACLVIAALWLLAVAVVVVYFHAIGRPLDPVVVAFLFSPGIGELGSAR